MVDQWLYTSCVYSTNTMHALCVCVCVCVCVWLVCDAGVSHATLMLMLMQEFAHLKNTFKEALTKPSLQGLTTCAGPDVRVFCPLLLYLFIDHCSSLGSSTSPLLLQSCPRFSYFLVHTLGVFPSKVCPDLPKPCHI